ncbi:MAG TPA: helix-turn-helix domain-containing protein [Rhodoglobus sp.]|nr:helix-turn-helix domain-containing protein [Rhodoglobus sp.]
MTGARSPIRPNEGDPGGAAQVQWDARGFSAKSPSFSRGGGVACSRAIRFSSLEAICAALDCEVGELLVASR